SRKGTLPWQGSSPPFNPVRPHHQNRRNPPILKALCRAARQESAEHRQNSSRGVVEYPWNLFAHGSKCKSPGSLRVLTRGFDPPTHTLGVAPPPFRWIGGKVVRNSVAYRIANSRIRRYDRRAGSRKGNRGRS